MLMLLGRIGYVYDAGYRGAYLQHGLCFMQECGDGS